jgi:hypothetical protein
MFSGAPKFCWLSFVGSQRRNLAAKIQDMAVCRIEVYPQKKPLLSKKTIVNGTYKMGYPSYKLV